MAQSAGFHENVDLLKPATLDYHRAIVSLTEELEAVDWYNQRVDAANDEELRAILAHNRDEEKEHAAMVLEWLRRHDAGFDARLHQYLFIDQPIVQKEEELNQAEAAGNRQNGSAERGGALGIGSLREEVPR
jgi:ferritin-like protein